MAWNEPGGSGDKDKNRDPWSNRPNQQGGPPDLDQVFKNLKKKIAALFSKGGGGQGNGSSGGSGSNRPSGAAIVPILAILGVLWLIYDTTYFIDQSERGVVTRFGKYVDTLQPGPNWLRFPRPIEFVQRVNVSEVKRLPLNARLLTKDLNVINISLVVQYRVKDEFTYAFRVRNPADSLKESVESTLREVVGGSTMDDILSESAGREKFINDTKIQIQKTIDKFETGLQVEKVNLENAQTPQEVQEAFQDAVKADKDDDRYIEEAKAFAQDIIPKAEGDAQRLIQEATAYRQQIINKAEGESSRFTQTLKEYRKAPEVTRKRMYLETMEHILSNTSKVVVKVQKGSNVMYLPIDRFIDRNKTGGNLSGTNMNETRQDVPAPAAAAPVAPVTTGRERDTRRH